jgi:NAD(P)-dependent dehydrogenase (short-subunit alcohol dehydrogenase family)
MSEQRVLITGATSGIGLVTARRFASRGARVAVLARSETGLAATRRQTADAGTECIAIAADVSDPQALHQAIEAAVSALDGLDLAVVNVGVSTYGRFRDTPPEDFDRVVDVTFRSAVYTVRELLPHLEASAGSLVVVGSVASSVPLPRMSAYAASKHALRGFLETLRVELRAERSPVSVSLIEPGPVDTPFWRNVASADGLLPPEIPYVYGPEEVAIAIERAARRPVRRASVGGLWVLVRFAYRMAPAPGERLLVGLLRLAERRGGHGRGNAAIWNPSGAGELRTGLRRRRSLLVRARRS